jgi:hypothetical protein
MRNLRYAKIERATNGSGANAESALVPIESNVFVWPTMMFATIALVSAATFFRVTFVDISGVEGTPSSWVSDSTPPPAPAAANVTIASAYGGIRALVNSTENPNADDTWRCYALAQADNTDGTNETVLAHFDGKDCFYGLAPGTTGKYFQVKSVDWVNNYSVWIPAAAVRADWLYPVDARLLLPANGDFQEIDPANPSMPRYWEVKSANGPDPEIGPGIYTSSIKAAALATSGGFLGGNYLTLTLGTPAVYPQTRPAFPWARPLNFSAKVRVLLPWTLASGEWVNVYIGIMFVNSVTEETIPTNSRTGTVKVNGPYTANTWSGPLTWTDSVIGGTDKSHAVMTFFEVSSNVNIVSANSVIGVDMVRLAIVE